jgi:hypothetical protein
LKKRKENYVVSLPKEDATSSSAQHLLPFAQQVK